MRHDKILERSLWVALCLSSTALAEQAPMQNPKDNTWVTADSTGDVGRYAAATLGMDGYAVFAYEDTTNRDLKFLKCNDGDCSAGGATPNTIRVIDSTGTTGRYPAIAIGADGFPIMCYYYADGGDLKIAKCGDASCSLGSITYSTVDATGDVGEHCSITISRGTSSTITPFPVVSYYDATNGRLKVAKCSNASCSSATLTVVDQAANVGWYTSIVTIPGDNHGAYQLVSYYDFTNGNLKLARCTGEGCTASTIYTIDSSANNVGLYSSITIPGDGLPIIAYHDGTVPLQLKTFKCWDQSCSGGNGGINTTIASEGKYTSITVGLDGLPMISAMSGSTLSFYKCQDQNCIDYSRTQSLSGNGSNGYTAITVDPLGRPVIAHSEASTNNFVIFRCGNAFCQRYWIRR